MHHPERKQPASVAIHPELKRVLFANPTSESLNIMIEYQLFDQLKPSLTEDILKLLPYWEYLACQGNETVEVLIRHLSKHSPELFAGNKLVEANLLRIRILAATPGIFSFPPLEIQEHLTQFLDTADILADLPQFEVIAFPLEEIKPLSSDLSRFRLTPHSRRYIRNLFHPERCEAILSVLAYIAKHYPLLRTCRQAYALMLSLDDADSWGQHPFCLRLIANRFWDYQSRTNE
ncbi:hypothetical protein REC12_00145 [Desulfosporosinus sp. PR]|uniref:hypothetical protein n=1 Tax=Candidatus Desulfosporosinus nitrosoreducens TaxID=3401928 RepID=UPI0027FBAF3D|nr:hypothetical protein [Desulfosporosinus sp. PR]MDQ7092004.1 hypothetical protein [Desulfosporosinus sp. PR]